PFTFGPPRSLMALPRFSEFEPLILFFRSSNERFKFLATCIAAMHWPRFLKPEHAVLRLPPGTEMPLFANALVSEVFNLPFSSTVLGDCEPMLECPIPDGPTSVGRPLVPAPTPDGAANPGPTRVGLPPPAPAAPCWAKAETPNANTATSVSNQLSELFFILMSSLKN